MSLIRKYVDYSTMYSALDELINLEPPQMELYYEIGRLVSGRPEKGAAAAAAEYLQRVYPYVSGFSPRSLRRMRDFYKMYGDNADMINLAMQVGWTQNIVILEADLTMDKRAWYLKASAHFGWSKSELIDQINASAHLAISLDNPEIDPDTPEENNCEKHYMPQFYFKRLKTSCKTWMLSGFRRQISLLAHPNIPLDPAEAVCYTVNAEDKEALCSGIKQAEHGLHNFFRKRKMSRGISNAAAKSHFSSRFDRTHKYHRFPAILPKQHSRIFAGGMCRLEILVPR